MNEQVPSPSRKWDGEYAVHSIFLTLQGEGPFSGDAAVFVRLEGCNIQCPFCDTDYTGGERAKTMTARAVLSEAMNLMNETACTLIVITGGEPFRQDLTELVGLFRQFGYRVQIETNGTLPPSESFKLMAAKAAVAIVVSPKAQKVDAWIEDNAIAYKYVLSADSIDPTDGLPVNVLGRKSQRVARPAHSSTQIFVQPADMHDDTRATETNVSATIVSATKFGYRLQLQIHKYLGVE